MYNNDLDLDVSLINKDQWAKEFSYPGDFGQGTQNKAILPFANVCEWRDYLLTLQIRSNGIPSIYVDKFNIALRILFLAWVDANIIKAAELQALLSMECALHGAYFRVLFNDEQEKRTALRGKCTKNREFCTFNNYCKPINDTSFYPGLCRYLDYMVAHDDLPRIYHSKEKKNDCSALYIIRNYLGHGATQSNLPWGGLVDVIREVIEHAYRNHPEHDSGLSQIPATATNVFGPTCLSYY
jgi:hypothetical protein